MPSLLEFREDVEEPLGLAFGQARRRLVEDEEPRLQRQRPGDFDELLLADRMRSCTSVRGEHVQAEAAGDLRRASA